MRGKERRVSFFRECKEELRRVSWTSKKELVLNTKIVVSSVFSLGIGIYVVDLVVRTALSGLAYIFGAFG